MTKNAEKTSPLEGRLKFVMNDALSIFKEAHQVFELEATPPINLTKDEEAIVSLLMIENHLGVIDDDSKQAVRSHTNKIIDSSISKKLMWRFLQRSLNIGTTSDRVDQIRDSVTAASVRLYPNLRHGETGNRPLYDQLERSSLKGQGDLIEDLNDFSESVWLIADDLKLQN
jgi:hypothetical protein